MNGEQSNPNEIDPRMEEQRDDTPHPRIYVASLADYNAGRLHGRWIDADRTRDELAEDIADVLGTSPEAFAEEWAIHDYEGFGPIHLGEYESMDTIARLAEGIRTHGEAFAHWASYVGTNDEMALQEFDDHYLGQWESVEAYAEHLVDEFGVDDQLQRLDLPLGSYMRVDTEALARDLEIELYIAGGEDGVYIFDTH